LAALQRSRRNKVGLDGCTERSTGLAFLIATAAATMLVAMLDRQRFKLRFGPYRTPKFKYGARVVDAIVRQEANVAIQHWWNVKASAVNRWRRASGVVGQTAPDTTNFGASTSTSPGDTERASWPTPNWATHNVGKRLPPAAEARR